MIYNIVYHFVIFLASMICGMCVNMFFITINTKYLCPLPSHITDLRNPNQLQEYVASLPILAYIIVMIAHYGQSMMGSYISIRYSTNRTCQRIFVYTIVLLTMVGSIMNNIAILDVVPKWFWIEIPIYPIMAYYIDTTFIQSSSPKQQPPSQRESKDVTTTTTTTTTKKKEQ